MLYVLVWFIPVAEGAGGVPAQECKPSDYEEWSPPQPGDCLLGRNYTMQVAATRCTAAPTKRLCAIYPVLAQH